MIPQLYFFIVTDFCLNAKDPPTLNFFTQRPHLTYCVLDCVTECVCPHTDHDNVSEHTICMSHYHHQHQPVSITADTQTLSRCTPALFTMYTLDCSVHMNTLLDCSVTLYTYHTLSYQRLALVRIFINEYTQLRVLDDEGCSGQN